MSAYDVRTIYTGQWVGPICYHVQANRETDGHRANGRPSVAYVSYRTALDAVEREKSAPPTLRATAPLWARWGTWRP